MNNSNSPKYEIERHEFGTREKPNVEKVSTLWLILILVFPIIFNVFFFVLGGINHNLSVWMSYGFIHFAYLMLISTPRLTRKGKNSTIFGLPLFTILAVYFTVALIAGTIFILVAPDDYTAALLVQLSLVGFYAIALIPHMIANEHTADAEEKRQYQIDYVKNATVQLKRILDKVMDKEAKRKVERAYDTVNSSPIKSHSNLEQIERRILTLIDELDDAVASGDKQAIISAADSLLSSVNDRNNRLKNYSQ